LKEIILSSLLETITIPPANGKAPEYLVVALHGWGANFHDLVGLVPMFNLPSYQFLFPNAPFSHPQVPGGRAWYSLDSSDYQGLEESQTTLLNWLKSLEETTQIPLNRTFLVGFSQGGAMSLDVGIKLPLAGVCSISGYLHYQPEIVENHTYPPVLMVHGKLDQVVPLSASHQGRDELTQIGVKVNYHEFPYMGHEIPQDALNTMQRFIEQYS
jgi:phospholipase/carboxylesterase